MTWLPLGFGTGNYPLGVMGICFVIYGLANRKKWKNEPQWTQLSDQDKKIMIGLIVGLSLLFLLGIAVYVFVA